MTKSLRIALLDYEEKFKKELLTKSQNINNKYNLIYKDEQEEFRFVFTFLHYKLNNLIDHMNKGLSYGYNENETIYYHAGESRELLDLIEKINEIVKISAESYKIIIDQNYENFIEVILPQIRRYGGSNIEGYNKFQLINYKPIFTIKENKTDFGEVMNIIFAADKYKPEIILDDALENKIRIVNNRKFCLVYDYQIINNNLSWRDLNQWWEKNHKGKLSERLLKSVQSSYIENLFLEAYLSLSKTAEQMDLPALIPQVYLHYDPKTIKQLTVEKKGKRLIHQRMDFLMLINGNRLVFELDDKEHYSEENKPSPHKYAKMVQYDRKMKLIGYDVYRFGGQEFNSDDIGNELELFFKQIFKKYAPYLLEKIC